MADSSGTDTYSDGASSPFGTATAVADSLSIFATYYRPALQTGDEFQVARLGFVTAQEEHAKHGVIPKPALVNIGWHGTGFDEEQGSFALVHDDGALAPLIGYHIRVRARNSTRNVILYVHAGADELDDDIDVSLTRRAFMEVGLLSSDYVLGYVEVVEAEAVEA